MHQPTEQRHAKKPSRVMIKGQDVHASANRTKKVCILFLLLLVGLSFISTFFLVFVLFYALVLCPCLVLSSQKNWFIRKIAISNFTGGSETFK
ncbi:hypothetical protein PRUPE_2G014600 [Prunus persica]|uniref:Uncharacterized protein n=1 Tax=Prunus persica TaxID=3760 RepID=A0A251Q9A7_PRUPE|nr:hypothetical protein PRUPE_2G014600 [Prunus persica]